MRRFDLCTRVLNISTSIRVKRQMKVERFCKTFFAKTFEFFVDPKYQVLLYNTSITIIIVIKTINAFC